MDKKSKKTKIINFKKVFFALILVMLIIILGVIIKSGKFEALEGYMYSFAADITGGQATSSNATSSNATSSNATSSNATSSNATSSNATSSNATSSNATSSNATSSNASKPDSSNTSTEKPTSSGTSTEKPTSSSTSTEKPTSSNTSKNGTNTSNNKIITNEKEMEPTIKNEDNIKTEYNNSELTIEVIKEIADNEEIENIIIRLDNNTKISKEIFEAFKGKSKQLTINSGNNQMIFSGETLKEAKEIDANITCNVIDDKSEFKEKLDSGIIVNFANNGQLPGKARIRIKLTDDMKAVLDTNSIFVYFYNEDAKEFIEILEGIDYTEDGFVEFTIEHNSKYVIVDEKIESDQYKEVESNTEQETVSFLESHKIYVLIIGASILVIIIVIVILIVDKKTKGKANNK